MNSRSRKHSSNAISRSCAIVFRCGSSTSRPGAGTSCTGALLIVALIKAGYRVGVTSNNHDAIGVLMKAFAEAAGEAGLRCSAVKCGREGDETLHPAIERVTSNSCVFDRPELPDLVGGTAWVFGKP